MSHQSTERADSGLTFFFLHVMKTGGSTFRSHLCNNFEIDEVYPVAGVDLSHIDATIRLDRVLNLPPDRRERTRVYTGHFPFVVTELLGLDLVTLTLLRDPVARTISYLKHCKRYHSQHRALSLEQIYDDEFFFPTLIWNHQTKIFSIDEHDDVESYMDVIEIDETRLERAKRNLERVDLVGVQEDFSSFVDDAAHRFGWRFDSIEDRRVGEDLPVSNSLRERIAADNPYDMKFHQFARELCRSRSDARSRA